MLLAHPFIACVWFSLYLRHERDSHDTELFRHYVPGWLNVIHNVEKQSFSVVCEDSAKFAVPVTSGLGSCLFHSKEKKKFLETSFKKYAIDCLLKFFFALKNRSFRQWAGSNKRFWKFKEACLALRLQIMPT